MGEEHWVVPSLNLSHNESKWGRNIGQFLHPICQSVKINILEQGTSDQLPLNLAGFFAFEFEIEFIDSFDLRIKIEKFYSKFIFLKSMLLPTSLGPVMSTGSSPGR